MCNIHYIVIYNTYYVPPTYSVIIHILSTHLILQGSYATHFSAYGHPNTFINNSCLIFLYIFFQLKTGYRRLSLLVDMINPVHVLICDSIQISVNMECTKRRQCLDNMCTNLSPKRIPCLISASIYFQKEFCYFIINGEFTTYNIINP